MPTNDLASETVAPEPGLRLRAPSPSDGRTLWELARSVDLDLNSPYAYVIWGEHFSATSVIATRGGAPVGFVTGFHPPELLDTLFVWQIGVASEARRTGLGARMLDHLLERTGARFLDATVTPDNVASAALFRSAAARHGTEVVEEPLFGAELFPPGHDAEVRFRIGPLTPPDMDRPTPT